MSSNEKGPMHQLWFTEASWTLFWHIRGPCWDEKDNVWVILCFKKWGCWKMQAWRHFIITDVDSVQKSFQHRGFTWTMDDFVEQAQTKVIHSHLENPSMCWPYFGEMLCVHSIVFVLSWAVKVLLSVCGLSILDDDCFCGCGQYDQTVQGRDD